MIARSDNDSPFPSQPSLLKKNTENVRAQQVLDASIRQGSDNAINAIDSEKKRSGWEKALYGEENPEYRAAQQRAVGNNIQQAYLEQANKISEFAGESAEEYQGRLRKGLDAQLAQYPNDAGTQQLITEHWSKASEKLVTQQAKEHHGHNLLQQRETVKNRVRGTLDVFTTESKNINTEKEALAFKQSAADFYSMKGKPSDMDAGAYRGVVNEELIYSLQSGNIGAYNMAKDHGWLDNLNTKEHAKFQAALNKYDIRANNGVALTLSEAKLGAKSAASVDDVANVLIQAESTLQAHEARSSGSDKSKAAIAKARLGLKTVADTALDAAADAKTKQDFNDNLKEAMISDDAAMQAELKASPKELEDMAGVIFTEQVSMATGQEDLTMSESIQEMFADPINVASKIVQEWGSSPHDAGYLKIMGQQYVNGYGSTGMVDEKNHQPTELAKNAMNVFAQFEQEDRGKFKTQLGETAYDEYKLIQHGQQAGKTSDMIEEDIRKFHEAVGNKDSWAVTWDITGEVDGKSVSRRDYVSKLVTDVTKQYPAGRDVGTHMETYMRGLTLAKGDHRLAKDYLRDSVKKKASLYKGQAIWGADRINSALETHTLPMLLQSFEDPLNNISVGLIAAGIGKSEDAAGNPIRTFAELGPTEFEVAVDGGLWIKNAKFTRNLYVSIEKLQEAEALVIQNRKTKDLEDTMKNGGLLKRMLDKITPMGFK